IGTTIGTAGIIQSTALILAGYKSRLVLATSSRAGPFPDSATSMRAVQSRDLARRVPSREDRERHVLVLSEVTKKRRTDASKNRSDESTKCVVEPRSRINGWPHSISAWTRPRQRPRRS